MAHTNVLLCTVLLLLVKTNSLVHTLPGLYLDNIQMWNIKGSENQPGTYNFNITWRQTLPGVVNSGLGLYNFKTGSNAILSYKTQMSVTTSSGNISVELVGSTIVYLAFSIVVITQSNNYIQLLSTQGQNLSSTYSSYSGNVIPMRVDISKSNWKIQIFHEWITGSTPSSFSYRNYWSWLSWSQHSFLKIIKISYSTDSRIYFTGVKINVIMMTTNISTAATIFSTFSAKTGKHFSKNFKYNIGINSQVFGAYSDGFCMLGLRIIDLYVYSSSTRNAEFLFLYNRTDVSDLSYKDCYGVQVDSFCYGYCPSPLVFHNSECITCDTVIPYCQTCSSATLCTKCIGAFQLASSKTSCQCPPRYFNNLSSLNCSSCPYDCYTCDSLGDCLSCNSAIDFRILENSTNRCVPMDGYFQSNATMCSQCPGACSLCTSLTNCSACSVRYFLNSLVDFCDPCPYDCFTCNNLGGCLSCSLTNDFRTLEMNASRCVPIAGYFDNNATVCIACSIGCNNCTSLANCFSCTERYAYNSSSMSCQACPYDCLTCDFGGNCLTCSSTIDFRYLSGVRCIPLVGYFESNSIIAGKCEQNCDFCSSSTTCSRCSASYFLKNGNCVGNCSSKFFQNVINMTCEACPPDCYTCDGSGNCLTCNGYSSHRMLVNDSLGNVRCQCYRGFYSNYNFGNYCPHCHSNCTSCLSYSYCTECKKDYVLNEGKCSKQVKLIWLWVILSVFSFGILTGLIIMIACMCKKRREQQQARQISGINFNPASPDPINEPTIEPIQVFPKPNLNPLKGTSVWRNRLDYSGLRTNCSICLYPETHFKSTCGHEFHVACIVEWGKKNEICPNCRANLAGRNNRLICSQCELKEKTLSFEDVKDLYSKGMKESEIKCNDCGEQLNYI